MNLRYCEQGNINMQKMDLLWVRRKTEKFIKEILPDCEPEKKRKQCQ